MSGSVLSPLHMFYTFILFSQHLREVDTINHILIYIWGNRSTEKWRNLPKDTHLASDGVSIGPRHLISFARMPEPVLTSNLCSLSHRPTPVDMELSVKAALKKKIDTIAVKNICNSTPTQYFLMISKYNLLLLLFDSSVYLWDSEVIWKNNMKGKEPLCHRHMHMCL